MQMNFVECPSYTHSKSQHNLSEVLVSYDSLLECFDWISGSGENAPDINDIHVLGDAITDGQMACASKSVGEMLKM